MQLRVPQIGQSSAENFVSSHMAHLVCDEIAGSERFRGGQAAADAALAAFDVTRYSGTRNEVFPRSKRGASALSPYIRHGLLPLQAVWKHVAGGPSRDVSKFRDELLWQEYSRHVYARLGSRTKGGLRHEHTPQHREWSWDRSMNCVDTVVTELETDGWLVNQTRMWLASEWTVRNGARWQDGEDEFFRHLLDGSRAANRLGWQWTTGVGSSKPYGFSRWQVNKRAPQLCNACDLKSECPIEDWPDDPKTVAIEVPVELGAVDAPSWLAGPATVDHGEQPETVWLTAESVGNDDPALQANPDLPVVFVFDEPLLSRLQLSSKRLIFFVETLAELAEHRHVELHLGDPVEVLSGQRVAVTHAPVPGFAKRAAHLAIVELHPWPWLAQPNNRSVRSFSGWRKGVRV